MNRFSIENIFSVDEQVFLVDLAKIAKNKNPNGPKKFDARLSTDLVLSNSWYTEAKPMRK